MTQKYTGSPEEGISRVVDIDDCSDESEDDFSSAISMYDGDWRASDRDLLQSEFALTDEETDHLVYLLESVEEWVADRRHYWTAESWGSAPLPKNWEDICEAANREIDKYIRKENVDLDDRYDQLFLSNFVEDLWKHFCETGEVGGCKAIYGEEEK